MSSPTGQLERDVRRAVLAARARGAQSFHEILAECEGADPRTVATVLAGLPMTTGGRDPTSAVARRETSELAALFPAADPLAYQWWFSLDSIEDLANRINGFVDGDALAAFIGCPTVGYMFSLRHGSASVFEVDDHVLGTLKTVERVTAIKHDVADELPEKEKSRYAAVLVDPPWYENCILSFVSRAIEAAKIGAPIFCSIPPRLTRPDVLEERDRLIATLREHHVRIVAIHPSATRYLVPDFERAAFSDLVEFDGRPWRTGDLLQLQKLHHSKPPVASFEEVRYPSVRSFTRDAKRFRVFVRTDTAPASEMSRWLEPIPAFATSVSRRQVDPATLAWWSTSRQGGRARDVAAVSVALEAWAEGDSKDATRSKLTETGLGHHHAQHLCEELDDLLKLWTEHAGGGVRRSAAPSSMSSDPTGPFATDTPTKRPYPRPDTSTFRTSFQRDRDRINWSRGLRQLAAKTQVFPIATDDFLRNRLSHSLEVTQLASTVGANFGLNDALIEAGALAHDIGHTPFGHAGEHALDHLFQNINTSLGGFNHYEHGVDVVRWLEDAYHSPALGGLPGLNLSSEVVECVFKHTYCQSVDRFSQDELYRRSKHQSYFQNDRCHVEGQAVRIADKVSYLISDLEDGIRTGVFSVDDLVGCRLLRRPPLDFHLSQGESLHERFLSQRGKLISLLMEDIIEHADRRLSALRNLSAVRSANEYAVDHSPEMRSEVSEVWQRLQSGKLHKDARVRLANMRAARIVTDLTLLFTFAPDLVDPSFYRAHRRLGDSEYMRHYRNAAGRTVVIDAHLLARGANDLPGALGMSPGRQEVKTENLVMAKDFVAGLSDERARNLHRDLIVI